MYTCELCGKPLVRNSKGYVVIDMDSGKRYVICPVCAKPVRIDKEKK